MKITKDAISNSRMPQSNRMYSDNDIVITGISGRFPLADNVEEFKENLYSKRNCIIYAEERWATGTPGCPSNELGMINNLSKFDAKFFDMTSDEADAEDPQTRIMFEVGYEAIVDAGYAPKELSGKRIGVFMGMSDSDTLGIQRNIAGSMKHKNITTYVACMVANKLSEKFHFTGPSFTLDAACSSAGIGVEEAFRRMRNGDIEAAIVGGSSLCLDPRVNSTYLAMGIHSPTNTSRPYDATGNGLTRGEAVTAIFIQKKKDARRFYCRILNIECDSAGYVPEGVFFPSMKAEANLFLKTYKKIGMDPAEIGFIEGHGTATPTGDPLEVNSICDFFCKNRNSPLLLGGIKSNIGHTEPVSGICGIAKIILAFELGVIAPNINFRTPNPNCPSLVDGRIKVVTEPTPYDLPVAALNNFGFGGVMVHIVLERNRTERTPDEDTKQETIPRLVVYAATTEKALTDMFEHFYRYQKPREFYSLLNKSAYLSPSVASYRGFTILNDQEQPITTVEKTAHTERQVWYIFTGMGCQWPGMGLELMKLDVFAESIRKSAKILEHLRIDLLELLQPDKDYLKQDRNITSAFVAIAAIQIALVDVLNAVGLKPDGIIGHSTGELVSSYADGCCTAEETLLSAYYRGISVERTDLPIGAMAAVGLSWEEAQRRCPKGVFPACDNAEDSVTISGTKDSIEKFVDQLTSENIFARTVDTYGYAFHCEYVASVSDALKDALQKVYRNPKCRTKRWLSTSFKESEWGTQACQLVDADYFCHNLISEVHFREAMAHIPRDAITIEIGPHFLLQSIVKRSIGGKASYIGLMKRNHDKNIDFLLSSIGKLYNLGFNPQVENLYPRVTYPVPRGTPMISPLIQWDHSQSFYVPKYSSLLIGNTRLAAKTSTTDSYLLDHCIEGRSLYPATGYIYLAWRTISDNLQKPMESLPILIENFKILRATILSPKDDKSFEVSILNVCGDFEIVEGGSAVATGRISVPRKPMLQEFSLEQRKSAELISGKEIYNELRIQGYEYGPEFQGLLEVSIDGTDGVVEWNGRWIPFLDSLLLFFGVIDGNNAFKLPTGALSIKIDPRVHMEFIASMTEKGLKGIPVKYDRNVKRCAAPGVEIRNLKLESAPHRPLTDIIPVWEDYCFTPYYEKDVFSAEQNLKCEEYIDVCCYLTRQVANKLKKSSNNESLLLDDAKPEKNIDIQEYLKLTEENYRILGAIQNIVEPCRSERLLSKISLENEHLSGIMGKDMLFEEVFHEKSIRPLLDIAVENSFGKMAFVEWCDSSPLLLPWVQDILKSCTQVKMSCTIIHPHMKPIDAEGLNENILVERTNNNNDIPSSFRDSGDVALTCFITGSRDSLKSRIRHAVSLAKEKGFILVVHKHKLTLPEEFLSLLTKQPFLIQSQIEMENAVHEENMEVVSKRSNYFGTTAYLLRKLPYRKEEIQQHVIKILDGKYSQWVQELKKAMALAQERDTSNEVWLVAQDTSTNGIIGMVNCLRQETGGEKLRCVFTDKTAPTFHLKSPFYADVLKKNLLMNVFKNGCWGSFRHTRLPAGKQTELLDFAYVDCTKLGDLTSFKWLENPLKYPSTSGYESEIYHVYYSAINFKDVMLATGKISANNVEENGNQASSFLLGFEFSGRDPSGRRIMAMVTGGSFCNTFIGKPFFAHEIPDHWTMEEAATVPVVYSTSYLALIIEGRLRHGEKILIHSGTGGVGQAAIRIALSMDCEVFTTVGTPEKRKLLLEIFPQVKPENIGCSRDTTFEEMIMMETGGRGVDVVLNSLADDKFQASVRCLAPHGRFLEIGKYDLQLDHSLGLNIFLKGVSFHGVMLDRYTTNTRESEELCSELQKLFADGIKRGVIQPLNTTVFPIQEVENAFRYMATGKHTGKILLKVREEEGKKAAVPSPMKMEAQRSFSLYPNKSYIIIGGLGGFGIELAKWLVQKSAGTVVLTSRYGARTPYHHFCLRRWKESGARVVVSSLNVSNKEEAKKLLQEISTEYGPIGGIFNSAVVLRDAFIENQSVAYFEEVCAPKAQATKHLNELSRTMCPELDLFVCFSSISCGKGNAGQTNYGYANSVMERICEQRRLDGLPGLAIQWGIIGEVGLVHRNMGDDAMIAGVMAQKIKSCLHSLEEFLLQDKPVVSSFVTADNAKIAMRSDDVLGQLAKMFSVPDIDQINPYRTFGEMGIDSMVGVELKQLMESSFDVSLTVQQIQDMKLNDIKKFMEEKEKNRNTSAINEKRNIEISRTKSLTPVEPVSALNSCKKGTPIFVIYGNELICEDHRKLWENVRCPVFALRCTKDTPMNTLTDLALWHLTEIWKACSDSPVHLISISTSSNVALDMLLQSQNTKSPQPIFKSWTILDGSLELIETHTTTEQEKRKKSSHYEASDLCKYLSGFSDSDLTGLEKELEYLPSLESRVSMIASLMPLSEKLEFIEAVEHFAKKQHLIRSHTPKGKLMKDLTVIEASEKLLPNDVSTLKSILSNICSGQIAIHRIPGGQQFLTEASSAVEVANLLNKLNEN